MLKLLFIFLSFLAANGVANYAAICDSVRHSVRNSVRVSTGSNLFLLQLHCHRPFVAYWMHLVKKSKI